MKYKTAVVTVSDRSYSGDREDISGPALKEIIHEEEIYEVVEEVVVPDEHHMICHQLIDLCDKGMDLILTTGGTGFSPRDVTPEATKEVCQRMAPGIPEAMRLHSSKFTERAWLSRAEAGIRDKTLIINLPGNPKALRENLEVVMPFLEHGMEMLLGGQADCGDTDED